MKAALSRSAPNGFAPNPHLGQIFYGLGLILVLLVFSGLFQREVLLQRYVTAAGATVTISLDTVSFFSPFFLSLGLASSAWPDLLRRRRSLGFLLTAVAVITALQIASPILAEVMTIPVLLALFRVFRPPRSTPMVFPLIGWLGGAISEASMAAAAVGGGLVPPLRTLGGSGIFDPIVVGFLLGSVALVVLFLLRRRQAEPGT